VNFFIGLVLMAITVFIKPFINRFHSALLAVFIFIYSIYRRKE